MMRETTRREGNAEAVQAIPRPVELLVGMRAIAAFLKISQEKVRDIEERGAPVIRDQSGVARAEKAELWAWWRAL